MDTSNMKNIVVLKNLPSNIVEEAIVVLKANQKIRNIEKVQNMKEVFTSNNNKNYNSKDYIVKEAELVVANYISSLEKPKKDMKENRKLQAKYKRAKSIAIAIGILYLLTILTNIIQ